MVALISRVYNLDAKTGTWKQVYSWRVPLFMLRVASWLPTPLLRFLLARLDIALDAQEIGLSEREALQIANSILAEVARLRGQLETGGLMFEFVDEEQQERNVIVVE